MAKRGTGGGTSNLSNLLPGNGSDTGDFNKGIDIKTLAGILTGKPSPTVNVDPTKLLGPQHINAGGTSPGQINGTNPAPAKAPKAAKAPNVMGSGVQAPAAPAPAKISNANGATAQAPVTRSATPATDPSLLNYATQAVNSELVPQLNALTRQGNQDSATTNNSIDLLNQMLNRQQGDTSSIYSKLSNYIGQKQASTDASYGNTIGQVGSNYDNLTNQLGQLSQTAQTNTGNELQRLGIQAVAPSALAQSSADGSFLQQLAASGKAGHLSALQQGQTDSDNLAAEQQGNQQATAAALNGQFARTNQQNVASALSSLASQKYQLAGQAADLQGQTGTQIQQLVTQLQSTALNNQLKEAALQGTLGLQGAQSNYYNDRGTSAVTDSNNASSLIPSEIALRGAQGDNAESGAALNAVKANNGGSLPGSSTSAPSGVAGATNYINSLQTDAATKAALLDGLNNIIKTQNPSSANNQATQNAISTYLTNKYPGIGAANLGNAQNAISILEGIYGKPGS